jgi:hypothetical protein
MNRTDRRSFLRIAGSSLGIGVLCSAYPAARSSGEAGNLLSTLGEMSFAAGIPQGETPLPIIRCI